MAASAGLVPALDGRAVVGCRGMVVLGPRLLPAPLAPQLGPMRLADQVTALVVEGRIEEEAVVLEREVLLGLANAAFTERHELLALGERAHSDSPFLECDWHREGEWRGV